MTTRRSLRLGGGEATPAAGWLKTIDDRPDANGVLWGGAEFTERAAKMLAAREYKYISPVIHWGARDKATGEQQGATITSLALTNTPQLERLPAIAFSEGWGGVAMESELDGAVMAGKITPAQRPFYEKMAMSDLDGFKTLMEMKPDGTAPTPAYQVLTVKPAKTLTVESAKTELEDMKQQWFAAIGKLLEKGLSHQDAVIELNNSNQDFIKRERQLLEFLKMAVTHVEASESRAGRGGKENMTVSERESTLEDIQDELDIKTRAKMAGTNLQYHEALKLVALENPHLDKQRARLQGGFDLQGGGSGPAGRLVASERAAGDLEKVAALIDQKTRAKVKESGGRLEYHEAMKLVASEHQELDRQHTQLQRAQFRTGDD